MRAVSVVNCRLTTENVDAFERFRPPPGFGLHKFESPPLRSYVRALVSGSRALDAFCDHAAPQKLGCYQIISLTDSARRAKKLDAQNG